MGIFDKFKIGFKKSASALTSGLKEIIIKKEIDDKNIIIRSMILKFIFYYSSKNLFLAFLTAFKTFFGAVPP